ncbi:hypothetical protein ALC53_09460 [Atta colombica]|uniref:Uncharacterized protein n=1 Tax=Atta colombica TaxID=520822 RepID=A0A195B792_9HYME|nr:hypothetical protein ALC53_09460 [Atta colombica]
MHRDGFICATAGNRHTTNGTNHLLVLSGGSALRVFAVYPAEEQGENRGRRRGRVGTRKRARHKKEPSDCWMERNKNNAVNAVRLRGRQIRASWVKFSLPPFLHYRASADAKHRNGRYLAAAISQDGVKRLDKKERRGKTCEGTIYSEKKVLCKRK